MYYISSFKSNILKSDSTNRISAHVVKVNVNHDRLRLYQNLSL